MGRRACMGLGRGGACIQCTSASGVCCRYTYTRAPPPLTPGMCLFAAAPGDPPVVDAPLHVALFKENPASKNDEAAKEALVSIGAGLPPVPRKLVTRIQAGDYIDMAELLPERLGADSEGGREDKKSKRPKRLISTISEWVQCYSVFMAVVAKKAPERMQDLLGYQAIIVEACMEYEGETWLGYDRRFRQMAAATPDTPWAKIDATLWNMAFTGHARVKRCKHCFGLSHKDAECTLAPALPASVASVAAQPKWGSRPRNSPVCKSWNFSQQATCDFKNCTYQHACLNCIKDPLATDKSHKLIHCPKRQPRTQQQVPHNQQQQQQQQQQQPAVPQAQRFRPY